LEISLIGGGAPVPFDDQVAGRHSSICNAICTQLISTAFAINHDLRNFADEIGIAGLKGSFCLYMLL